MSRAMAWLLALVMLVAVWWLAGHPGWESAEQQYRHAQPTEQSVAPKLYRWRDEKGVTQITQVPPTGRKYTVVNIRDDQNIIESAQPNPEPPK